MKELNTTELREIQLDILKKVTSFCERRNINYSLYGGTLLGAIRHKGYIPWDDDIDISMPRPDYNRLIEDFHLINDKNLKINAYEIDKKYPYPFIKVSDESTKLKEYLKVNYSIGVNIDIFPIDGLPYSDAKTNRIMREAMLLKKIFEIKWQKIRRNREIYKNLILIVAKPFCKLLSIKFLLNRYIKLTSEYDYDTCDYIGNIVWGYGRKERCEKECYGGYIRVNFENSTFYSMKGYDTYLRNVFNDYLQLPPVEKQVSNHNFKAYLK